MSAALVEWAYPAVVVLAGYLVLGITGMGSALVVVPLLALRWPLPEVVALAILLDVPASLLHGGLNLSQVRWRELTRLVPGLLLGTLLGIWLMGQWHARWPLLVLGIYVVLVALRSLRPVASREAVHACWAQPAALVMGLIEVMFATTGPVVVAWLQLRSLEVAALRATVPVVMALAGCVAMPVLLGSGAASMEVVLPRWLAALPIAFGGVWVGNRLARHVPPAAMRRTLAGMLLVSGLVLVRQALG